MENVLAESGMMIPDCHEHLEAALTDLKGTLPGGCYEFVSVEKAMMALVAGLEYRSTFRAKNLKAQDYDETFEAIGFDMIGEEELEIG